MVPPYTAAGYAWPRSIYLVLGYACYYIYEFIYMLFMFDFVNFCLGLYMSENVTFIYDAMFI